MDINNATLNDTTFMILKNNQLSIHIHLSYTIYGWGSTLQLIKHYINGIKFNFYYVYEKMYANK